MTPSASDGARSPGTTLIVQTGDYAEAYDRFAAGGGETFRDQRRSVDFVADRARSRPITLVCRTAAPYDRELGPGLRAIGMPPAKFHASGSGRRMLDLAAPARLLMRCPHVPSLRAATDAGLPVFACFADIMIQVKARDFLTRGGLRRWWHNRTLSRLLARPSVVAVANNGRQAVRSLESVLGVPRERILMHEHDPIPLDPVEPPADGVGSAREGILYVGTLSAAKGVGDLLRAVARLPGLRLRLAGDGPDRAALEAEAAPLGDRVTFLGRLPGDEVRAEMRRARAVVVASRHGHAEGMPNVITETLSTRTPLILSDHPAYSGLFEMDETAAIFRAADPDDLARTIRRVQEDPEMEKRLAANAGRALERVDVGHRIYDLMDAFFEDDTDATGWVRRLSLAGESGQWF